MKHILNVGDYIIDFHRTYNTGKYILLAHTEGDWVFHPSPPEYDGHARYALVHMDHRKILEYLLDGGKVQDEYREYESVSDFLESYVEDKEYLKIPESLTQKLEGTYAQNSKEVMELYYRNGYGTGTYHPSAGFITVDAHGNLYLSMNLIRTECKEVYIKDGSFHYVKVVKEKPVIPEVPAPIVKVYQGMGKGNDINFTSEIIFDDGMTGNIEAIEFDPNKTYIVTVHEVSTNPNDAPLNCCGSAAEGE